MRGPVRFREREASRAVRAAEKAGLTVERIEVAADGRLSLVTSHGKQDAATEIGTAKCRRRGCGPARQRVWGASRSYYVAKNGAAVGSRRVMREAD
jgi:hypothetical protein